MESICNSWVLKKFFFYSGRQKYHGKGFLILMKAVKISQACEVQMQFYERNVKSASEGTGEKCKKKITFHKNDTYMQH